MSNCELMKSANKIMQINGCPWILTLICLIVLINVRSRIGRGESWVWGILTLISLDLICYAGWYWQYEVPLQKGILAIQLALVPFALIVLIRRWRAFRVTILTIVALLSATAISIIVVYLRSQYLPNETDWAIDPPFYFERLVYSNFHYPQESGLALVFICFLIVSCFLRAVLPRKKQISSDSL